MRYSTVITARRNSILKLELSAALGNYVMRAISACEIYSVT